MNKHDESIQNLFDNYASELTAREDLAVKAKMEMVERNTQPSASARRNSSSWIHFAWIAPVAVVFIAVVAVIFTLPLFGGPGGMFNDGETPSTPSVNAVAYYSYADVKGKSVSIDDYDRYDDVLQVNRLVENEYQVLGRRYYAFYTEQGELRYIKAYLGVRAPDGTFTELSLIAEVDGYVRKDLQDIYRRYSSHSGLSADSGYDDKGEYVTQAYFATDDLHFYVVARNGQRTAVATEILQYLAGIVE